MKTDDLKKLLLCFRTIGICMAFPNLTKRLYNDYEKQEIERLKKIEYERMSKLYIH